MGDAKTFVVALVAGIVAGVTSYGLQQLAAVWLQQYQNDVAEQLQEQMGGGFDMGGLQ